MKGTVRRLQAVTVCINYADYLACVLANARHFDRWIVITVPEDQETAELCRKHGIECHQSRTLRRDGSDFDAAFNKAAVVNEALDLLEPKGWAMILDADVRLPRDFRARISALPLESGALYGMAGRKICAERAMFDMLLEAEPWDRYCARHSGIFGYVNLFDLEQPLNRYRASGGGPQHDDDRFQERFPLSHRRVLPMTVLHTGPQWRNWSRRKTPRFEENGPVARRSVALAPPGNEGDSPVPLANLRSRTEGAFAAEERTSASAIVASGVAALIGYFPGNGSRSWLERFSRVYLVDHFGVHTPSGATLIEADRAVLRRLWQREIQGLRHLRQLGAHSTQALERIPDGSLDLLHLPGEVAPSWLVQALPLWLAKLKDGALVCGDLFSPTHLPDSTYAISLLLGVPDHVGPSGAWMKRFRRPKQAPVPEYPLALPVRVQTEEPAPEEGVVFVHRGTASLEPLFLSLHSLRQHWRGQVTVYQWGTSDPSLAIVCARYAVRLEEVGHGFATARGRAADLMAEALAVCPFARALLAPAGTLFRGDPTPLFTSGGRRTTRIMPRRPRLRIEDRGATAHHALPFVAATSFDPAVHPGPLLVCSGAPGRWSDAAWSAWQTIEAEFTAALACAVRTPPRCVILTVVDRVSARVFARNWPAWKFGGAPPVWVALDGVRESELPFADGCAPEKLLPLAGRGGAALAQAVHAAVAEQFIVIPPTAIPLPGADLLAAERWPGADVYLHAKPDPLFTIASAEHFARALESASAGRSSTSFAAQLRSALLATDARIHLFDAALLGWRWPGAVREPGRD